MTAPLEVEKRSAAELVDADLSPTIIKRLQRQIKGVERKSHARMPGKKRNKKRRGYKQKQYVGHPLTKKTLDTNRKPLKKVKRFQLKQPKLLRNLPIKKISEY